MLRVWYDIYYEYEIVLINAVRKLIQSAQVKAQVLDLP